MADISRTRIISTPASNLSDQALLDQIAICQAELDARAAAEDEAVERMSGAEADAFIAANEDGLSRAVAALG